MGWLQARFYDRFIRPTEDACLAAWRASLLSELDGEVLEIGAGTGLNLPYYSDRVTRLVLSEPDRHMRARLASRIRSAAPATVELSDAALESLPMPDDSFSAVVSTLVLCSVNDLARGLGEIKRVLVPGGKFAFLEHVAAEDRPQRLKWQQRFEPLWVSISGNCHLARRTERAIVAAGFDIAHVKRESIRKAIPLVRPSIRGIARNPDPK